jgi:hypothetical protein
LMKALIISGDAGQALGVSNVRLEEDANGTQDCG